MQPGTPPRQFSRCVNGHGVIAIPAVDSDHSKQFDGQLSLPAADARPNRSTLVRRCGEAEVSRWITAESTVTGASRD